MSLTTNTQKIKLALPQVDPEELREQHHLMNLCTLAVCHHHAPLPWFVSATASPFGILTAHLLSEVILRFICSWVQPSFPTRACVCVCAQTQNVRPCALSSRSGFGWALRLVKGNAEPRGHIPLHFPWQRWQGTSCARFHTKRLRGVDAVPLATDPRRNNNNTTTAGCARLPLPP